MQVVNWRVETIHFIMLFLCISHSSLWLNRENISKILISVGMVLNVASCYNVSLVVIIKYWMYVLAFIWYAGSVLGWKALNNFNFEDRFTRWKRFHTKHHSIHCISMKYVCVYQNPLFTSMKCNWLPQMNYWMAFCIRWKPI